MASGISNPDHDDFLTIFPLEIWDIILDEMIKLSFEEVEKLRLSSPFFRRLLQSRLPELLFPQVLDVLHTTGHFLPKIKVRDEEDETFSMAAVHNDWANCYRFNCVEDKILSIRRVCKIWRVTLDNFYRKQLLHQRPEVVAYGANFEQVFRPVSIVNFYPRTSIPSFLTYFSDPQGHSRGSGEYSPFLTRECTFMFREVRVVDQEQFMTDVTTLLTKYGSVLEKCTFDFRDINYCRMYLRKLFQWLKLLPNLRKLEIIGWVYPPRVRRADPPLEENLGRCHAPRMSKLECLVLAGVDRPVATNILRGNNHLARLDLSYSSNQEGLISIHGLSNLTHLRLAVHTKAQFDHFAASKLSALLQKVELVLYPVDHELSSVFGALEKVCPQTLEHLSMVILHGGVYKDDSESVVQECENYQALCLPNVKKFHVDVKMTPSRLSMALRMNAVMTELLYNRSGIIL